MNNARTPRRRHRGLERVELAYTLQIAYEQGTSIRALSKDTGLSYGKVHRLLLETGTTLRARGGQPQLPN